MTTLTHAEARDALLADERRPAVDRHLAACAPCRHFGAALDQVTGAGVDVPPVPAGLADRVIERVRADHPPTVAPPVPWARRLLFPVTGVAAAVVLVLAGLALAGSSDRSGDSVPVLVSAARSTEAAGPAQLTMEGSTEVTVETTPGRAPDLAGVPAEMRASLEARWRQVEAEFNRQMAEFEQRMQDFGRAIDETLDGFGSGVGPRLGQPGQPAPTAPTAPPAGRPEPPARPGQVAVAVTVNGSGVIDAGQALHVRGAVRAGDRPGSASFELSAGTGAAAVRRPDGVWVRADTGSGPLSSLLGPGGIGALLRRGGDARLAGRTEVDGVAVEEYRFTVTARPGQRWAVQAFVDADRLLRRLSVRASGELGADAGYVTSLTLGLSAHGQGRVPPGPSRVSGAPAVSSALLGPLAPGAGAALAR